MHAHNGRRMDLCFQEFMSKTKGLEDRLMEANQEKELLEGEAARMHGNGRSLAERNRKQAVDARLGLLGREIGTIRMNLKQMGALRL